MGGSIGEGLESLQRDGAMADAAPGGGWTVGSSEDERARRSSSSQAAARGDGEGDTGQDATQAVLRLEGAAGADASQAARLQQQQTSRCVGRHVRMTASRCTDGSDGQRADEGQRLRGACDVDDQQRQRRGERRGATTRWRLLEMRMKEIKEREDPCLENQNHGVETPLNAMTRKDSTRIRTITLTWRPM
ncbi:hypothetical protein Scep_010475 [Stephania cephalantha]|uniref:Uncharacterized protein n=1 Tax=Stephania cephalantha TaxID=152367 RepID=A0AAP0JVW6_9MAGN